MQVNELQIRACQRMLRQSQVFNQYWLKDLKLWEWLQANSGINSNGCQVHIKLQLPTIEMEGK